MKQLYKVLPVLFVMIVCLRVHTWLYLDFWYRTLTTKRPQGVQNLDVNMGKHPLVGLKDDVNAGSGWICMSLTYFRRADEQTLFLHACSSHRPPSRVWREKGTAHEWGSNRLCVHEGFIRDTAKAAAPSGAEHSLLVLRRLCQCFPVSFLFICTFCWTGFSSILGLNLKEKL